MGDDLAKKEPDFLIKGGMFNVAANLSEPEFEESLDDLCSMLLFDTRWKDTVKNRKVRAELPIINNVNLICQAKECPFYKKCPVMKGLQKEEQEKLIGTDCRVEREFGIRLFTSWIKELNVDPIETTTIFDIASLVRLAILRQRMDWRMAIEGDQLMQPIATDKGVKFFKMENHFLAASDRLGKEMDSTLKRLVASRRDKMDLMAKAKGKTVFDDLLALSDGAIDAEFKEE